MDSTTEEKSIEIHYNLFVQQTKGISMNHNYYTQKMREYTHLDYESYRSIESELKQFEPTPQQRKTALLKALAGDIHTSLSNLYAILKAGEITLHHPRRPASVEFSADAAWSRRHAQRMSNSSKILKAQSFIQKVAKDFQDPTIIDSIDEIIGKAIRSEERKPRVMAPFSRWLSEQPASKSYSN